jgi:hypothetical protein
MFVTHATRSHEGDEPMNTNSESSTHSMHAQPHVNPRLGKTANVVSWVLQVVVAAILFQTLFFKFSGAEESKYIFRTLGAEPWGRLGSGVVELIAVVLLLTPRTVVFGAILSLGVISGAIMSHLTKLGIEVQNDGGLLFGLAVLVFLGSLGILAVRRAQIPIVGPKLAQIGAGLRS